MAVWRDRDALDSDAGALLVDTVALDDFSGVVLMALLSIWRRCGWADHLPVGTAGAVSAAAGKSAFRREAQPRTHLESAQPQVCLRNTGTRILTWYGG